MSRSFLQRRLQKSPDYELDARIIGASWPGGGVQWNVEIDGYDDPYLAAGILERAAEVLRGDDAADHHERTFNEEVFA